MKDGLKHIYADQTSFTSCASYHKQKSIHDIPVPGEENLLPPFQTDMNPFPVYLTPFPDFFLQWNTLSFQTLWK